MTVTRPTRTIEVNVRTDDLDTEVKRIEAYLWGNFSVRSTAPVSEIDDAYTTVTVVGTDVAGWTADALVARLGSGNFGAKVVA
jgi:hypothetical protein